MSPAAAAGVAVYWVLHFCVDSCFPSPEFPHAFPRYETAFDWAKQDKKDFDEVNNKTRCEQARTDLMDKGSSADRWVKVGCVEEPRNGKFHYLEQKERSR